MEAIEIVHHCHVEWRSRRTFFFIATHMHVVVIVAPVRQTMNQPRISVIREDHRLVSREQRIEIVITESVRVLG